MTDVALILEQLKSWKNGYLPPSAAILMGEAHDLIEEQSQQIADLKDSLNSALSRLEEKCSFPKRKADPQW